ncbi:MAG TPA: hypothetical protein VLH08_15620 [Acidobacteriota bacterium]|nr:hypothetical protein [Acidobacteriota bacterium]
MTITEPVTVLTDYILAIETIVFGILLRKHAAQTKEIPVKFWSIAFFVIALAAITGGTCHGFVNDLPKSVYNFLWKITLYSVGASTLFMLSAAIQSTLTGTLRRIFLILAWAQFCIFIILIARTSDFKYVIYDYVPAMVVILVLCLFRWNSAFSKWIIGGILVSFVAAGIQLSGFTLHKNFNHNDLYHVIQMVAMYLLYEGAKRSTTPK